MRSLTKLMFCLGVVAALVAANPAFARKKTMTGMVEEAVDNLVQSHESVTLPAKGTVEVAFSPKGGCTAATVRFIGEAKQSIRVAAYGLTSNPIGKALLEAKKRGVDVRVVVDKEQNGKRDTPNRLLQRSRGDQSEPVQLRRSHFRLSESD